MAKDCPFENDIASADHPTLNPGETPCQGIARYAREALARGDRVEAARITAIGAVTFFGLMKPKKALDALTKSKSTAPTTSGAKVNEPFYPPGLQR